jgi:hypothetical protein
MLASQKRIRANENSGQRFASSFEGERKISEQSRIPARRFADVVKRSIDDPLYRSRSA